MEQIEYKILENLLIETSKIVKKYETITQKTGEKFNIFNILNLRNKELIHSAFIAELLNPNGSHYFGTIFLGFFIEELSLDHEYDSESLQKATVYVEKAFDNGRIDIYIQIPNKRNIIIENKIYAGDQEEQLYRYFEFDKQAHIIYLTLWGSEASENSKQGLKHILNISYQENIKNWLEKSLVISTSKPLVKENIAQYLNIVNSLTNQSPNDMESEIIKLIIDKKLAGTAQFIHNQWLNIINQIVENLRIKVPFQSIINIKEKDFIIEWNSDEKDYKRIYVGVKIKDNESSIEEKLFKEIQNKFENNVEIIKPSYPNTWIMYKYVVEWENTSWDEVLEKMPEILQAEINMIIEKLNVN
ncbi:MAG: PD-(D/E)XK nuclease family protein [Raineya sp.]|jgi:hypothetical protein|nr:PD-(D/E)XK nuclease family protein [Raineya sp.]